MLYIRNYCLHLVYRGTKAQKGQVQGHMAKAASKAAFNLHLYCAPPHWDHLAPNLEAF